MNKGIFIKGFRYRRYFNFDEADEDNPNVSNKRPVILIAENENKFLLLISITTNQKNDSERTYDKYKVPILNWMKSDFPRAQWAKAKYLIRVKCKDIESKIRQCDHIDRMHYEDFNKLIEEVEKIYK